MSDLTAADTHFAFGKNWRSFASLIGDQRIAQSDAGIARLFGPGELDGKTVIDIGCGSGLPALSLMRAGAKHVTCIDIDPDSVAATTQTLSSHAPKSAWSAEVHSVFDLTGTYDVVHSWGVLHHTGDMWRAIDKAASLVKSQGLLAIAIYGKGKLCGFWKHEKRFYARSPRALQDLITWAYVAIFYAWFLAKGRNPARVIREHNERGMDWMHDARDWLGGYPYESATPDEIQTFLEQRGFRLLRSNTSKPNLKSGCDEYVFTRG